MSGSKTDARAQAEKRVGQTLNGKWRIDRVLDMGGMAAVFAATHRNGHKVAIKMLHPHIAANVDVRERFLREGYVANQVAHPGALQILDDDTTPDGSVFIVMELLEGDSLERWILKSPNGRVRLHEVLGVADQVLDTLSAFHARNVIHRDIKPGNLFITKEGSVKVLDFGLARLRDPRVANYAPTGAGIVLGTVAYMPPEQAQGKSDEVDARTDIFAVGAVMFQAMTGKLFIKGDTAIERLMNAMKDPAPSITTYLPGIPDYIADVVDTALAFDKKNRWADANEMRTAIRVAYAALVAEVKDAKKEPSSPPIALSNPKKKGISAPPGPPEIRPKSTSRPSLQIVDEDSIVIDSSAIEEVIPQSRQESEIPTLIKQKAPVSAKFATPEEVSEMLAEVLNPSVVVDVSFGVKKASSE